jgi:hypothetical protein
MTTLLNMVRQRRTELEIQSLQHLGPITDEDRDRAIRHCIADAPHDPAAAEKLRKVCALGPEVGDRVKELAVEMQAGDVLDDVLRQKPREARRLHPIG